MKRPWVIVVTVLAAFGIAVATGLAYVLLRYKSYYAPSDSMAPTIVTHQAFLADRFAYRDGTPQRGDIVVFIPPIPSSNPFFKRIVAVPGDEYAIRGGRAFLNGKPVVERYVREPTNYDLKVGGYGIVVDGSALDPAYAAIPPRAEWKSADTVPPGCYVVLGDNRNNSQDSHVYGFLCPDQPAPYDKAVRPAIIGRAMLSQP